MVKRLNNRGKLTIKIRRAYARYCLKEATHLLNGWEDSHAPLTRFNSRWISNGVDVCYIAFGTGLVNGTLNQRHLDLKQSFIEINRKKNPNRKVEEADITNMTSLLTDLVETLETDPKYNI